jgi:small ligand-binding sensory domain FIST
VQGPARAVAIAEAPAEGAGLAFLSREAVGARDAMREALSRARASGALDRPPAFGVYFDCASRGSALYGAEGLDATLIRRELGAFPLAGFFTSFEIGPVGGAPGVHLFTGVLALAPSAKA